MKIRIAAFSVAMLTLSASIAVAADVNFDVNLKSKQGNTETTINVGNRPSTPPAPIIIKEKKTVIIKEGERVKEEEHDRGKKKGHYKDKHKKHKKEHHKEKHED